MIIYYNKKYNIDFGPLNKLHPFDGLKFKKVYQQIKNLPNIQIQSPTKSISDQEIDEYVDVPFRKLRHQKSYIFQALELPPFLCYPFGW
jgi:histone deacetylase 11